MLQPGDQVIIAKSPKSLTVRGHGNKLAVLVRPSGADEFLLQIDGMPGKAGQRRVLTEDLAPSGQLRML